MNCDRILTKAIDLREGGTKDMANDSKAKLYKILNMLENAGKDKNEIKKIRKLLDTGKLEEALSKIRELNNSTQTSSTGEKKKRGRKKKIKTEEVKEPQEEIKNIRTKNKKAVEEKAEKEELEEDLEKQAEDEEYEDSYESIYNNYANNKGYAEEYMEKDELDENEENDEAETQKDNAEEEYDNDEDAEEDDDYDEDEDDEKLKEWGIKEDDDVVYKEEEKKQESVFPEKLRDEELEKTYIGLLLNNPKLIVKYYLLFEECYFDDQSLLNIYKSILFTEGGKFTPEIAKKGFSFSVDNNETYKLKQKIKFEVSEENSNPEKVYIELRKLCILRKSYLEEPREEVQDQIVDIRDYELYDKMSPDEIKAAIVQVSVTQKFKQAVLSEDLTEFLEKGENNLTNGLELPFPILSSVFKGIRKGETMAFAMPSNSGKSRFTINLSAYTAFVHKKKVLVISNEMSEEKMKLCLITTVLNNPEIQKLHGQKISKTEGELLEFKFRPNKDAKVNVDEEGFILQEPNETRRQFVERLKTVSDEFNKTIAVTDWVNNQINNSIYFINITDHTNDELQKVIMNYYYKEKIEYVFYDTLKTDTANIGNGEEIKRTATILSNLAQNFNMFICSTLQLTESTTLPINLTVNDLAVSRTVKEVLDTLCLIKQIMRDDLDKYEYSLEEVDTKFYELEKFKDPDVRYYACVVDKNRAGAKPKVLFRLNLAYNVWNELGYLKLKVGE